MDRTRSLPARTLRSLRDTRWLSLIGYAFSFFLVGTLLLFLVPAGLRPYVKRLPVVAALLLFVAKDFAHFPDLVDRLRRAALRPARWRAILAALPPTELVGLVRVDRAQWRGFIAWVRRSPKPPRPDGSQFTFLERGSYPTLVGIMLVCICVEVPIDIGILSLFVKDPHARQLIHIVLGILTAYSLVWVLGDRWLVRGSNHVLTASELDLQVGARLTGRIPLAALTRSEPLTQSRAEWCKRRGHALADTVLVSPIDRPNVVLTLAPGNGVSLLEWGCERTGPACVFLYVDRPGLLLAALAS
jgi:hypothetical protein